MLLLVSTLQLTGDHYSYSGVIVYPLFLHFVSPLFPALEIFLALLGAVGLIAANRVSSEIRVRQLSLGLLVIPIGIALWGLMSVALGRVPQPIQVSSVHFGDHVYDLIADPCYKMDSLCPPTSYIVLKCDSLGVVCQLWAVPWSETEYNKVSVDS